MKTQPYLEFTVVGYGVWQSHSLFSAWFHSPFDRWGWLAFVLWAAPLLGSAVQERRTWFGGTEPGWRLLVTGLVLTFLGDLGSFNASCNAGLALILLSFAPAQGRTLTAGISALSWMPALGWLGSRFALDPTALNVLRVIIAFIGAASVLKAGRRGNEGFRWPPQPLAIQSSNYGISTRE